MLGYFVLLGLMFCAGLYGGYWVGRDSGERQGRDSTASRTGSFYNTNDVEGRPE